VKRFKSRVIPWLWGVSLFFFCPSFLLPKVAEADHWLAYENGNCFTYMNWLGLLKIEKQRKLPRPCPKKSVMLEESLFIELVTNCIKTGDRPGVTQSLGLQTEQVKAD